MTPAVLAGISDLRCLSAFGVVLVMMNRLWLVIVVIGILFAAYNAPEYYRIARKTAYAAKEKAVQSELDRLYQAKYGMPRHSWIMKHTYWDCVKRAEAEYPNRKIGYGLFGTISKADYVNLECNSDSIGSRDISLPVDYGRSTYNLVLLEQAAVGLGLVVGFVASSYLILCQLIPWIIWGHTPFRRSLRQISN